MDHTEPGNGESEFLARLMELRPDIGGTARLDMTSIPTTSWRRCRELAEAHGWTLHSFEHERNARYWILVRRGTTPVRRGELGFVRGPSVEDLRQYPEARAAARQAHRELGVDPLSGKALERARVRHRELYRHAQRRIVLAVLCGLTLFAVPLSTARAMRESTTVAVSVGGVAVVLLGGLVVGWLGARRYLRRRDAAVAPYVTGYERVVGAVFAAHGRPGDEVASGSGRPVKTDPDHSDRTDTTPE